MTGSVATVTPPVTRSRRRSDSLGRVVRLMAAVVIALVVLFPLYWMVVVALTDRSDLLSGTLRLVPSSLTLENLRQVFREFPVGSWFANSVAISVTVAVLTVVDTGPGIPEDLQRRVFERFTRADVSRVRTPTGSDGGSTGLGLAIVAAVVEAHQGTVSVHSVPGRTEFTVRLPLA